jgi:hypothetical protein
LLLLFRIEAEFIGVEVVLKIELFLTITALRASATVVAGYRVTAVAHFRLSSHGVS